MYLVSFDKYRRVKFTKVVMPYILEDLKLAVFFSPKCAGTSVRSAMFEIENGFQFRPYSVQGKFYDENSLLKNNRIGSIDPNVFRDYTCVAIVRDPVRRFLSAYANRVVFYQELSEKIAGEDLATYGLPANPDLEGFVANHANYCRASSSINRHFFNQKRWVGTEPSRFKFIFRVEALAEFEKFLEEFSAKKVALPRLQTGGPKIRVSDISPETHEKIIALVANDVAYKFAPEYREVLAEH